MTDNKTKLILEAYQNIGTKSNKYQPIVEHFWDDVYTSTVLITESYQQQKQFQLIEEEIFQQALMLTEAELPIYFQMLEEGWKDKLKAVAKGAGKLAAAGTKLAAKGAVAAAKKTGEYMAKDDNLLHKVKDTQKKVGGAIAKGAMATAKGLAKGAKAFAKEVIPDDWQKKGKEIIEKVKNKLSAVYDAKIKPIAIKMADMLKKLPMGTTYQESMNIIQQAFQTGEFKKAMQQLGADKQQKETENYIVKTLKDNSGSLMAASAAMLFPPASAWIGVKIAMTILIPIVMDLFIKHQEQKLKEIEKAEKSGAKTVKDFLDMKKSGHFKNPQIQGGQPEAAPA